MDNQTKNCTKCSQTFPIYKEDTAFYNKMTVPSPTLCPACRECRRLVWRNERSLYARKCARTGKPIISYIRPDSPIPVYSLEEWFKDDWDARDYGIEIDWNRPFFEQFRELLERVPHIPLLIGDSENCEYTNYSWCNKSSYMISAADFNEDCFYSSYLFHSRDSGDCFFVDDCELCYECVDCEKCYNANHCKQCKSCSDCTACEDCVGCNHCFGCINLRNQNYCIFNLQYERSEYETRIKELLRNPQELSRKFGALRMKEPIRAIYISKCENCIGNNLSNCSRCFNCFDLLESQDCRYVTYGTSSRDCMDLNGAPECELQYECVASPSSYNCRFCTACWVKSSYLTYCHLCRASQNCFGCISLYRNRFCILNRQYKEQEYKALEARLTEHMQKTGEWGEFFPTSISPFKYEETAAQDYYPK
ncbi:MAG: hypothetical protein WC604_03045 [Candidatus Gracilibacteria bacterium]